MRWYASKMRKEESSDDVWKSRNWQSRIFDAVRQCVPGHRTRNRKRPDGRTACDGGVERRAAVLLDAAYWRYWRPVCRDPPSMAEPCTADNGGQSRRACSRLAAVYPTSAVRHAVTRTVRGRTFACCWRHEQRRSELAGACRSVY